MIGNKTYFLIFSCISYLWFLPNLTQATKLIPSDNFTHNVALLPDDGYHLFWKFDEEYITFEVHVKTHGYVGFGISTNGGMVGADVIIAWLKDGQAHFHDRWAWREFEPDIDEIQDWELLEAYETDTHTVLKFMRPLVTCDTVQDLPITADTVRVIWSYHDQDPEEEKGLPHHGEDPNRRGSRSLYLLDHNPMPSGPDDEPPGEIYWDFTMQNVTIPETDTTYWCQSFKVPELEGKHHAIKIEPMIQEENVAFVHHMILFRCDRDLDESKDHHNASYDCYFDPMIYGTTLLECNAIIATWGVGGGPFEYPENAGYPYGEVDSPKYLRLEIHYDNPFGKAGMVDNSGFRVWLTSNLRQHDASMLLTGVRFSEHPIIPKSFESMIARAHCPVECFEKAFGTSQSEGIHIFAAMVHTHLLGTGIHVRHIRDGKELPMIAKDDHFDFDFQESRLLPEEITFLPTDEIITECTYTSLERYKTTYGGFSTQNEMCYSFMHYYPKMNLTSCESSPDPKRYQDLMDGATVVDSDALDQTGFPSGIIKTPDIYYGTPYQYIVEVSDWSNKTVRDKYQEIIGEGATYAKCQYYSYDEHMFISEMPEITEPYVEPESECIEGTPLDSAASRSIQATAIIVTITLCFMSKWMF